MNAALAHAFARLRRRRSRALLGAAGIALVGAMVGAAATVAFSLSTGFDRAARAADLADVTARFDPQSVATVDARARALPDVAGVAYRLETRGAEIRSVGRENEHAKLEGIRPGRRGYAIVAGRDLSGAADEVVIERGLASTWGIGPGADLDVYVYPGGHGFLHVVGVAVAPDDLAYPLTNGPRLYVPYETVRGLSGVLADTVNVALLWAHDPKVVDVLLAQARVASFGLTGLQFVTRRGIEIQIGQAAGIVVSLLIAFSIVVVVASGALLAASAAAEVQRRRTSIGLLRALGVGRAAVGGAYAAEAAVVAAPAAALGLIAGAAAVVVPTRRLLDVLNELGPRFALAGPLALALAGIVALVALASAWPAWRAAVRPPVQTLRQADLASTPRRLFLPGGAFGLGLRLGVSRPLRTLATSLVLAAAVSIVLLLLTLASTLGRLETDAGALGKRYSLEVSAPATAAARIGRLPGVVGAAARYETDVADSFQLGEPFRLIAYAGDHTRFEAPTLAQGRRAGGRNEAEVGLGLAQALNLHPGATLAAQLPTGMEVRFRVVGIVRALANEGRIAYVAAGPLLRADPGLPATIAVLLQPGERAATVERELAAAGFAAQTPGGATGSAGGLLGVIALLLRSIAAVVALVCLYVLAQTLVLTAEERRGAVALLRAVGGSRRDVGYVLAGAAAVVVALAAPIGILLERTVVGPSVQRLGASYVSLALAPTPLQALLVVAGVVAVAALACALVARTAVRRQIVAGLREE